MTIGAELAGAAGALGPPLLRPPRNFICSIKWGENSSKSTLAPVDMTDSQYAILGNFLLQNQ